IGFANPPFRKPRIARRCVIRQKKSTGKSKVFTVSVASLMPLLIADRCHNREMIRRGFPFVAVRKNTISEYLEGLGKENMINAAVTCLLDIESVERWTRCIFQFGKFVSVCYFAAFIKYAVTFVTLVYIKITHYDHRDAGTQFVCLFDD